jgi:hypothetical protein
MLVDAEHGSAFGFRPNLERNSNSRTSNALALASHGQEEILNFEPDTLGFVIVVFFFLSFISLSIIR